MVAKTERFGLVLSRKDKELLEALAKKHGESRSVVIRELIREAAAGLRLKKVKDGEETVDVSQLF